MPPRPSIIVDRIGLLRAIQRAAQDDLKAAERALGPRPWHGRIGELLAAREVAEAGWTHYDLQRFVGRDLTPSERIRHQQAIRELEAAGLVELSGVRATAVRITELGRAEIKRNAK